MLEAAMVSLDSWFLAALLVLAGLAGTYGVKGRRAFVKWRRHVKRRHRAAELHQARERAAAWEPRRLENSLWPRAGSRLRAADGPTPDVREHLSLLVEATARLQADLSRGLEIIEIVSRVDRIHRHHAHVLDLLDARRN